MIQIKHLQSQTIQESDLHVWIYKDDEEIDIELFLSFLDANERARYDQFSAPRKQREFLVGRGFLKKVVAQYLNRPAQEIDIHLSQGGKPYLENSSLQISLSHSNQAFACALGLKRAIGVDIESTERKMRMGYLRHACAVIEREYLNTLSPEAMKNRFMEIWSLKESVWKAIDPSDDLPFPKFHFSFDPLELHSEISALNEVSWELALLPLDFGHLVALAAIKNPSETLNVEFFQLISCS